MADKKISALDAIVSVDDADVLPIVDTSVTTTKKINVSQIKALAPVQSVASKTGAVTLVKGDVGLGNVDNTADADKPVSTATQTALNAKQDTLVSGTNIKTVNSNSLLGSGNIEISSSVAWGGITGTLSTQTDLQSALDGKQATITGAATTIDTEDLTASRALVSDGSGKVAVSDVTSTELGYLDGVTSAVQTQVDAKTDKLISLNTQTGTTYTLVLGDADKLVEMNNAAANTLTVPPNSSVAFSTGTQIIVVQKGAGTTTIAAGSGVTLLSKDSALGIGGQYGAATCIKIATDTWYVIGDLA